MAELGIKLADGSFFPIMDDNHVRRRRVVLSVAQEGQLSAQVNLVRKDGEIEQYLGSLVVDEVEPNGEIEFVLGSDGSGGVQATLRGTPDGEQQRLQTTITETADDDLTFTLPDDQFGDLSDMAEIDDFDIDVSADVENITVESPRVAIDDDELAPALQEEPPTRPFRGLTLVAILLIVLSVITLGAFFVFRWLQTDVLPDLRAAVPPLIATRRFSARLRRRL